MQDMLECSFTVKDIKPLSNERRDNLPAGIDVTDIGSVVHESHLMCLPPDPDVDPRVFRLRMHVQ